MDLTKEAIVSLIKRPNPIVLEVGIYDGEDSRELAKLLPNAVIHGFECDPRSIALFKSFPVCTNITLHETALSDRTGLMDLHLSDSDTRRHYVDQKEWSASSSLRKPKEHLNLFDDVEFKRTIKVPSTTLDKWNINQEISFIDFIWADVNGAEYDFILGAQQTLNTRTKYLYIEFSDKELYEGQRTKGQMLNLLPNFKEIGIYNFFGNFGNVLLENTSL